MDEDGGMMSMGSPQACSRDGAREAPLTSDTHCVCMCIGLCITSTAGQAMNPGTCDSKDYMQVQDHT